MKQYTFSQLVSILERAGSNLAEVAVGRMMDIIGEQTGSWPAWSDVAPAWAVRNCLGEVGRK